MSRWLLVSAAWLVVCASTTGAERAVARVDDTRAHVGRGSIAAGRAHSVLAAPDGRVYTWGAGGRGQLGDGTLRDRWTPTMVAGLEGIVAVSAGAAHTVALSHAGEVFAWGANADGRLGDGTSRRRPSPVRVLGLTNVRMIAAGRAHTLALTSDGRVFAWGLNEDGQVGNGKKVSASRPVRVTGLDDVVTIAAGEAHSLAVTRDGRVHAWGRNESSELGDGTTRNRLRPVTIGLKDVVGVAAGGTHSLAVLRSGAVYSWGSGAHGELGTGAKTVSSRPKIVPGLTARAIDAGRHFSAAVTDEGWLLMWGANASGQLGNGTTTRRLRPAVVPGLEPVTDVALGATHVIAVTTGGDVRTWGEGRLGRLGNGTVRDQREPLEVMAGVPDWGEDPAVPAPPSDDTVPPTISVSTSPPLQSGWMTTAVTVTFECSDDVGVAVCPAPVTVDEDAAARTVGGTAIDSAGNQATASVTLNVDVDGPGFLIDHPQPGESFDAASLVLSGRIQDVGSGVAYVRCNGQLIAVEGDAIQCSIMLSLGRNDIVLQAADRVGHTATASVTVFRKATTSQTLRFAPSVRRLAIGETAKLSVHDEAGAAVSGASWSVADPRVASLGTDDPSVITAHDVGETIVTAEKDGVRADMTIIVAAALGAGDVRWTLPAVDGLFSEPPLFANRVDVEGPSLFAIDTATWLDATLRALSSEGELLWQQYVPGRPLMGDSFGGVVVGVPYSNWSVAFRAYLRTGGGSVRPWRYESAGMLGPPAQSRDGTIYTTEYIVGGQNPNGQEIRDAYATVIDGRTGDVISRTRLPREVDAFTSANDGVVLSPTVQCRSYRYETSPETLGPVVGSDGKGYWVVRRHEIQKYADCMEPSSRRADRTIAMGLDLMVLSPDGAAEMVDIFSASCEAAIGTTLPCDLPVRATQVMPDGIGGTLAVWERGTEMVGTAVFVQRSLTRVDEERQVTERPVLQQFSLELIGQEGTAFTFDGDWKAVDVRTGDVEWSRLPPAVGARAARPDGGVAALDFSTRELVMIDANGAEESRQPFGLHWTAVHTGQDWIGLKDGQLTAVAGEFADATRFMALKGNAQGQLSVRLPGIGIWLKTHNAFGALPFQHTSIRVTPRDQDWLMQNRARFETCSDEQCVPLGLDRFGNLFFTIGAGSGAADSTPLCDGILTKGFNRPKDVQEPPIQPLMELPLDFQIQPLLINSLLQRFDAFSNRLLYHCFPEDRPGFYNSNSFAHGLLHAASVGHEETPPSRGPVPGWLTPVPIEFFSKQ